MKKLFGTSVAMVVVALAAMMLTSLAPTGALSASARERAQTAAAHQAFVKFMSSHAPMMRATGSAATLESSPSVSEVGSYNWSGFADAQTGSTPVSSVSANWTIPYVSCIYGQYRNQDVFLAQWVGLDGFNDQTVEQLGTATQCYEGVEYYYDWYEMFPNGTVEEGTTQCINNNVDCPRPGDQIQASVTSTTVGSNNNYSLQLRDFSNPAQSFSVSASCPTNTCLNSSAEWIVERPAFDLPFGFQILPQADYGQTAFSNGTVSAGGSRPTTIENYSGTVYDIAMIDDSEGYFLSCPGQYGPPGQLLLLPSGCPPTTPFHGNFSDTWDSSF
jgi:Peptidase A4 family